jgi:hypothetical protein
MTRLWGWDVMHDLLFSLNANVKYRVFRNGWQRLLATRWGRVNSKLPQRE